MSRMSFNTSYITINRRITEIRSNRNVVSIHPILLLIMSARTELMEQICFNTSYITINLSLYWVLLCRRKSFNTSYITINPRRTITLLTVSDSFNTSYITINQRIHYHYSGSNLFQYILYYY